jgi:RimK family alpha-L-glutamate ligase
MVTTQIKVGILGLKDSWHGQALLRAWQKLGVEPVFEDVIQLKTHVGESNHVACGETVLSDLDLVMVREVPGGTLEQVIYRMDALHQLENMGVRLVNPAGAIEKMVDKYYTLSLLQAAGLCVPQTAVTENFVDAMALFEQLGGDVVVKPMFGSRGIGMVRVTDAEVAGRVFKALQLGGYVFYLQQFIPHNNRDLRVMVCGNQCLAAMERVSDSWKTNVSRGAKPWAFQVTQEIREASLKAANAVGANYCGVDLMYGEDDNLYLLEINSMPAWQGLQQVTEFDIAERLVENFAGLMKQSRFLSMVV